MTIKVVARIRPQQSNELDKDVIVSTVGDGDSSIQPALVKIPNPKNSGEIFTFQFSSVYNETATQQQIFENEVSPTIKHLFNGLDTTIFAYGSTGTGKTHTMRGGKRIDARGIIPRLLSGIHRRARKINASGQSTADISLSYYEIYNDKVFDLFEAPEKRSLAGLPLREQGGKTQVVGLTERPCESLKDFERLYDQANVNRSTSATKLNAASSRSHAILGIKLKVTTQDDIRISTASAIDLAGSEDNRRTDNGKERMVESASINKSLFTLAKCVESISKGDARVPYRESKMTRILSLGQNKGLTLMFLNIAPVKSYHLDTLSSLNFANRTRTIETREVENEPVFKGCSRGISSFVRTSMHRQPLRPLTGAIHNSAVHASNNTVKPADKHTKAFSVYSDHVRLPEANTSVSRPAMSQRTSPLKRQNPCLTSNTRPVKRPSGPMKPQLPMSKAAIEDIIDRKVTDILAARALDQGSVVVQPDISEEVQRRLDTLEQRIEGRDDAREQGLTFLLMAKQHAVRGEDGSALKMYTLALEFFPHNKKLEAKIAKFRQKLQQKKQEEGQRQTRDERHSTNILQHSTDEEPQDPADAGGDQNGSGEHALYTAKRKEKADVKSIARLPDLRMDDNGCETPRTRMLLNIINTRDLSRIRSLKGIGAKKAEGMVEALCLAAPHDESWSKKINNLQELGQLKGVGVKTVENMRLGLTEYAGD